MGAQYSVLCGRCPRNCCVRAITNSSGQLLMKGAQCDRGIDLGHIVSRSRRHLIRAYAPVSDGTYIMVGTDKKVLADVCPAIMDEIDALMLERPLTKKQVIRANVAGSGANLIIT